MNFVAEIIGLQFALETQLGNIVVFERSKQRVKKGSHENAQKKLFSNDRFFVTVKRNIFPLSHPRRFATGQSLIRLLDAD